MSKKTNPFANTSGIGELTAQWIAMDLADLTQRETEEILSGAEPNEGLNPFLGGGKVSDDSVRLQFAKGARGDAWRRLRVVRDGSYLQGKIHHCIEQLDQFIADLEQEGSDG